MASSKEKQYKKALERWSQHKLDISSATSQQPKGSETERQARIARARKDYAYFVETYFPHLATSKCGKFQVDAANELRDNPRARNLEEWARGHAKSTHITLCVPLWLKIQPDAEPLIVPIVSKSLDSAKRLLGDLQAEFESNELYINDFGQQHGAGMWTDGEFVTTAGDLFIALGRGQSPRGIKKRGLRPNLIIVDDIDDDELVRNPRRVADVVDWLLTALFGTMAMGRGRMVVVGNRIGQVSVISTLAENPRFHHRVINALDKKGRPSWPENYAPEEIAETRAIMGERRFQKEMMNNPIIEGAVFLRKNICYGKMLPLRDYAALVCYTDPSFKSGTSNDFKATLLVGITKEGDFHVIKAFADQTSVSKMIEWHYDLYDLVGDTPCRFMMEANFIQDTILDSFRKTGIQFGRQLPLVGDMRAKPDKFGRIEALQPWFERGEVIFNEKERKSPGMMVLEEQLLMFQKGSSNAVHDDAPDALEGAVWILQNRARHTEHRYVAAARPSRRY